MSTPRIEETLAGNFRYGGVQDDIAGATAVTIS